MNGNKKKRLEGKGWKVGNAEQFLGLSDEEKTYIAIRLRRISKQEPAMLKQSKIFPG